MKYKSLDKKSIKIMRINALIIFIVVLCIYLPFCFLDFKIGKDISLIVNVLAISILSILFLNFLVFPRIRYQRYKYLVTDELIDVKEGLIIITRSLVPIERVQKIELTNGPIDRHYGLSTMVIYTAAGTVLIKFLETKEAESIANKLNKIIKGKNNEIK